MRIYINKGSRSVPVWEEVLFTDARTLGGKSLENIYEFVNRKVENLMHVDQATRLFTPRSFSITGRGKSSPVEFDGTNDVFMSLDTLDADALYGKIPTNVQAYTKAVTTSDTSIATTEFVDISLKKLLKELTVVDNARKLLTPRYLSVKGAITTTQHAFDGASDVEIFATKVDASKLYGLAPVDTTGNAATASKIKTPVYISISGAAKAYGELFDGSNNLQLNVVSLDASSLQGVASVSTTGNAATASIAEELRNNASFTVSNAVQAGAVQYNGRYDVNIPINSLYSSYLSGDIPSQISVLGNAATASKWRYSRALSLYGGATGSANFDGSQDFSLYVSSLDASKLSGSIPSTVSFSGAAAKANQLAYARSISISGGATASGVSFDGSSSVSLNVTRVEADVVKGSPNFTGMTINGSNAIFFSNGGLAIGGTAQYGESDATNGITPSNTYVGLRNVFVPNTVYAIRIKAKDGVYEGTTQLSDRNLKKDIEPFVETMMGRTALEEIESTQVYSYLYNSDDDGVPKRLGLIYQEAPFDIVTPNPETPGIDLYAMSTMMWKGMQELSAKIESIKAENEQLKNDLDMLQKEIAG